MLLVGHVLSAVHLLADTRWLSAVHPKLCSLCSVPGVRHLTGCGLQALPDLLKQEAADWDVDMRSLVSALHECDQPPEGTPLGQHQAVLRTAVACHAPVPRTVLPEAPGDGRLFDCSNCTCMY